MLKEDGGGGIGSADVGIVTIKAVNIRSTGDFGVAVNTNVTLESVDVSKTIEAVIVGLSGASMGPLIVTGGTFVNNGAGIDLAGPMSLKVRKSYFIENSGIVVGGVFEAASYIDLGTPDSPGDNTFKSCPNCESIVDLRPVMASGVKAITASGNSWYLGHNDQLVAVPEGCSDTDFPKGSTTPPRTWRIANPGTCSPLKGNVLVR